VLAFPIATAREVCVLGIGEDDVDSLALRA
jgi:hypothetical protein